MKTWQKLKNNPRLWDRYFLRERVIKEIRNFFDKQGFHEVETPVLIGHPLAESYIDVFTTTLFDRNRRPYTLYLSTSPEAQLKKLMVAGIGNCYSITKSFRNTETDSKTHSPEFTILEWYRVGKTYLDIMGDCEKLMAELCQSIFQKKRLPYQGREIDFSKPWSKISVSEAFDQWAHIDFNDFLIEENAREIAKKKGYRVTDENTWEEVYNQIYLNEIEPHLKESGPVFIYDFPSSLAALSQKKRNDPRFSERFEFYIGGLELGDCYTELTDWKEQKNRFDREMRMIKKTHKTPYEYDADFIDALKEGLPPCSGIAVGIDRLLMLFMNVTDVAETQFFPQKDIC